MTMCAHASHLRILTAGWDDDPRASQTFEFESGDAAQVTPSAADGTVLLTVDDIDDSPVPTLRLTPTEAAQLALRLAQASKKASGGT
jgi:hypothetical protein